MVKFAIFLLHTIYKRLRRRCPSELEELRFPFARPVPEREGGSSWRPTGRHGNNKEYDAVSWKKNKRFITLRGSSTFSASSVFEKTPRENISSPQMIKKTTKTAPSLYIVYIFVHLYIDRFIQIDSFFSQFPRFPVGWSGF